VVKDLVDILVEVSIQEVDVALCMTCKDEEEIEEKREEYILMRMAIIFQKRILMD
jgi:hypothetical protein